MEPDAIRINDLTFGYDKGKDVIKNLSASFRAGKITAIIGANGCGKSTLLNLIAGVYTPGSGEILINDKNIAEYKRGDLARTVACVHQKNTAPDDMTVETLVALGRTPYKKYFGRGDEKHDNDAVESAMADADIMSYREKCVSELSGGQLQRVWLAMGLAQETDILLLDEITTFLDIHYQIRILSLIRELNNNKKITVVTVLHDINLAMEFCDDVLIMKNGEVLYSGEIGSGLEPSRLDEAFDVVTETATYGDGRIFYVFKNKLRAKNV